MLLNLSASFKINSNQNQESRDAQAHRQEENSIKSNTFSLLCHIFLNLLENSLDLILTQRCVNQYTQNERYILI